VGHTIAIRDLNLGSKEWARVFGTFPPGGGGMSLVH
jgi:hypothetical protein